MRLLCFQILFAIAALLFLTPVTAKWEVETRTDSMTDDEITTASVQNESGHTLSVYIRDTIAFGETKSAVWAAFRLSKTSADLIGSENLPVYRVDKKDPHDLQNNKTITETSDGAMTTYLWEPKWVQWQIYHGQNEVVSDGSLYELMSGGSVVFRYYLPTGGYKETSFTLEGSRDAIQRATRVRMD